MMATGRVTLRYAALVSGRTETTIRTWTFAGLLHPEDTRRRHGLGTIRLYDLDELHSVNAARGGSWYPERLRHETDDTALAALTAGEAERAALQAVMRGDSLDEVWEHIRALEAAQHQQHQLRFDHVAGSNKVLPALPDASAVAAVDVNGHEAGNATTLDPVTPVGISLTVGASIARPLVGLPPGLVGLMAFARLHGARESQRTTFVKGAEAGRLPIRRGRWSQGWGSGVVEMALDAAGQRAFYVRFHRAAWFVRCPDCPHALAAPLE